MTYYDIFDSPVGLLLVTGDGANVTGLYLEDHKGGPAVADDWKRDADRFVAVREQLRDYFAGKLQSFDLPLKMRGTGFQEAVWAELKAIPLGKTVTYGDLAGKLGRPKASRAVGAAVGRNPVSIIVPCHRVLGSGGSMTGYAGGVERKRKLLALEHSQ
jgi:methylated-DNA-[protein]-cysteine S-methyltransferase